MPQIYNDPANSAASTIGSQIRTDFHQKKALVELKKLQYFSQLANTTSMPKNFGKKIKQYHYMPMLDERNINDQGIDAAGATISTANYFVQLPRLVETYAVEADATAAAAAINAITSGAAVKTGAANPWTVTFSATSFTAATETLSDAVVAAITGAVATQGSGNLYGSSKDIGMISSKLPALSETGGRVNRVGFKRIELEGTMHKFGFFDEYTQESLNFDTDDQLEAHINREMLNGAAEITEDALQIDLLTSGTTIRYAGAATSNATVTGATGSVCMVDYTDLSKLSVDLDDNRTPKHTKIITGSRMVDTKVINSARVMYIGSELISVVEKMTDHFSKQAFIPVQHYAAAGEILNGEIGTIGQFRIVVVPEMMHWEGAGAVEGTNAGYRAANGRYNVYPMLVVGDESFTTIGFQTDGKTVKFKIFHKKPGEATADRTDPFGETGFMSIKWYYGFMALRSERIAVLKTVAEQ
jgi:N4-gp56 family major capsid protein